MLFVGLNFYTEVVSMVKQYLIVRKRLMVGSESSRALSPEALCQCLLYYGNVWSF